MDEASAARWVLARRLLRDRAYAAAWPLYEARRDLSWIDVWRPITSAPEWSGREDLTGKKIVVCAEQGYGDQIMFGRYLPHLRARGAEIVVACDPRALGRLFEAAGYPTRPFWSDRPIPECDYWTCFGSLPLLLGIPAPPPAAYIPLPLSGGGGVGVMCTGNPRSRFDAERSLSGVDRARAQQLGRDLDPAATRARDFIETAEIVAGLDLVISVDTAMSHLAGALGKPCWVLLPHEHFDWRWNDGLRSDWYPGFRLFRQPRRGDWGSVLSEVEEALGQGRRGCDVEDDVAIATSRGRPGPAA